MTIRKENRIVPITLAEFHRRKLDLICRRTGLSKTGVVQRMIEKFDLLESEKAGIEEK